MGADGDGSEYEGEGTILQDNRCATEGVPEYRSSFRKVGEDLTPADAADILINHVTLAANQ
jgi:hypothetical protein